MFVRDITVKQRGILTVKNIRDAIGTPKIDW